MPLAIIGTVLYKDAAITEEGNGSGTGGESIAAPIHLAKISFGAARARGVRIAASRPYGRCRGILAANGERCDSQPARAAFYGAGGSGTHFSRRAAIAGDRRSAQPVFAAADRHETDCLGRFRHIAASNPFMGRRG